MEDVSPSLETLCERYSEYKPDAIKALYGVYGEDASLVYSCLAEGVPLEYLLQQLNSHFITVNSSEAPRIRIEKDDGGLMWLLHFIKDEVFVRMLLLHW